MVGSIYFVPEVAMSSKAALEELNARLNEYIEELSANLQSMSECWGSEQNDFFCIKLSLRNVLINIRV